MFSLLWSEHCAYKHSKKLLRRLPTEGERVVMGPGENAGAVDVGNGYAIAFKVESHNHPSAVEPFQGAATGVGGILRDVFALGARPIAILDSLRFGELDSVRSRHLLDGAVRGIGHYGNSIGVANVGGEIYFEEPYEHNCLVNAMCVGIARTDEMVRAAAAGVGNAVVLMGASTGRDGIGGASVLASAELGEGDEAKRPTVQIGDPFEESKVLECCLELLEQGAARLAPGPRRRRAHLLGQRDGVGRRGRDRPRRRQGAAARGRHGALRDHGLRVAGADARRGRAGTGRRGAGGLREMADRSAPRSARSPITAWSASFATARSSARCRSRRWSTAARSTTSSPRRRRAGSTATARPSTDGASSEQTLLALLSSPSVASKRWAFEQYDSVVGSRTARRPESADAAVLIAARVRQRDRGLDRRQRAAGRLRPPRRHRRGRPRVRPEPRLRRGGAARADQLPQLRQPREAGSGLAARPGGDGARRGLRSARRAGRRRQRLPLQRGARRPDLPDPGGRHGRRAARPGPGRRLRLRRRGRRDRAARPVRTEPRRLGAGEAARRARRRAAGAARSRLSSPPARRCARRSAAESSPPPTTSATAGSPAPWSSPRSRGGVGFKVDLQPLRERGCSPEEALFGEGTGGFVLSGERDALERLGAVLLGDGRRPDDRDRRRRPQRRRRARRGGERLALAAGAARRLIRLRLRQSPRLLRLSSRKNRQSKGRHRWQGSSSWQHSALVLAISVDGCQQRLCRDRIRRQLHRRPRPRWRNSAHPFRAQLAGRARCRWPRRPPGSSPAGS